MPTAEELNQLPQTVQTAVSEFIDAMSAALGENLLCVAMYGSAARGSYEAGRSDVNLLLIVAQLDTGVMRRMLGPVAQARAARIAPFCLGRGELAAAAAAFPAKFMTIREERKVLRGADLLADLEISRAQLKLRCQQEACNLLLHLRRRYLLQGGHGLTELLAREVGGFLDTLRTALTLVGERFMSREEAIEPAAKRFGFDAKVLHEIIALRTASPSPGHEHVEALLGQWLELIADVQKKLERIDQVIG